MNILLEITLTRSKIEKYFFGIKYFEHFFKYGLAVLVSKSQIVRHFGPAAGKRSSVAKSSTGCKN